MMKRALMIALALPAFGQSASRYDTAVYSVNASAPLPGGFYPVLAYPGAAGVALHTRSGVTVQEGLGLSAAHSKDSIFQVKL